ncbi:MAG: DUF4445 domain-containing protein [Firmicutes bacterium]|nr:DUF4445 domain-containing protein [Bacillota bacterium]
MNIKIIRENEEYDINGYRGEKISDVMKRAGIAVEYDCGGIGKCGKCKVKIKEGKSMISETEKEILSNGELKEGIRLACCGKITGECTFEVKKAENNFSIVQKSIGNIVVRGNEEGYAAAIDIGTTTVCYRLFDMMSGETVAEVSGLNPQREYGADVIARIEKANRGELIKESELIKNDIMSNILKLTEMGEKKGIRKTLINKTLISGNTAMLYLLLGYDCEKLGVYPFENRINKVLRIKSEELFERDICGDVIIMPCISAFVGGDIVSGALFCDVDKKNNSLMIDIGTNGEMILNKDGRLYCTSAAAGPAFEGGNISDGTGSISGAVYEVRCENGKFSVKTINDEKPVGICGTGIIDAVACLIGNGYIDENGLLNEKYFENGVKICDNVTIRQKDIRNIQLAKSAIRTAIDIIIKESGAEYDEIEEIFIGGGFGYYIDIENCIKTGLLPKIFGGKIKTVGNCSLGGAMMMINEEEIKRAENICKMTKEIILAEKEGFNERFIENLKFFS